MPDNRRSTTRYTVSLPATVTVESRAYELEIVNLSLGGAFVEHDERLPIGTRVELTFCIPNREQPIEIGAQVRWVAESGVGVQFDGLRAGEVWSLNQFLKSVSS